jgi:hypothetical protein
MGFASGLLVILLLGLGKPISRFAHESNLSCLWLIAVMGRLEA